MRHYEIMLLVHPDHSEQIGAIHDRYQKMVQDGNGKVHRFEDWGRLSLAYRIAGAQKGHYALFNIEVDYPTIQQIRESLTLNEQVIRFLVVRREKAETAASQALENLLTQRNDRNDRKGRPSRKQSDGEDGDAGEAKDADAGDGGRDGRGRSSRRQSDGDAGEAKDADAGDGKDGKDAADTADTEQKEAEEA